MSNFKSKISYLKGLADGKEIAKEGNIGQIVTELIGVVSDLIDENDALKEKLNRVEAFNDELQEVMEMVDDLMGDYLTGMAEDGEFPFTDFDIEDDEDEEDYLSDLDIYEVTCKNCGAKYYAEFDDFMEDDVVCPQCDTKYELTEDILEKLGKESKHHDE